MTVYTLEAVDFTRHANVCLNAVISGLEEFGEIEPYQAQKIRDSYAIIACERGWFGRVFDTLLGDTKNALLFKLVRVHPEKFEPAKVNTSELADGR